MSKVKHALIIPDCHIPYEDPKAYNLMLKVAKTGLGNLDEIVILGDYGEFLTVSTHPKDPSAERFLKEEVKQVNARLTQLDKMFPKARKVFIEGNHEYRVSRWVRDNAALLDGIVDAKELLQIRHRKNWIWVPYGPNQKYRVLGSHLYARHEPFGGGEYPAGSTVKKAVKSTIFGHTHRISEHQIVDITGSNYRGINPGWLGNKDHKVFDFVKGHHQWALGFSIVTVTPDKTFFAQTIHIINGKCSFGGKIYESN